MIETSELADLARILDPDVHIAIWRRSPDQRITELLQRPECHLSNPSRSIARTSDSDFGTTVAELVPATAAALDREGARALAADVQLLCEAFGELVAADELMISLEEPDEATCPRFHVDRVGIRMLVTYCGPGTEWLPHEHCDRRFLGEAGMDQPDDQNGVMRPGAEVRNVPPHGVVLLKGEAWPGAENFGAVHRSPDPGDELRIMLRVDMLSQLPLEADAATTNPR
ncbi:MAG: DUF1826 domain-containing protein [bacterium]|nr:DUF1826 domain-containing protein [bacterium]